jgi:hypothetical protein
MRLFRNPLLPIGLLLVVVGLGNWLTGRDKTIEHERLLSTGEVAEPVQQFEEFDNLSARTNATLLRPFQRGADPSALIQSKLDFYRVVQAGGQLLIFLGFFAAVAGVIHSWYRVRHTERGPTAPHHI